MAVYSLFILLLFCSCDSLPMYSSCTDKTAAWNYGETVAPQLKSWLHSLVTVKGKGKVQSMLFDPEEGVFTEHFAHFNDITDKEDRSEDSKRRVVTVGTFTEGLPAGLTWQWRSKRMLDGFLYGKVNAEGKFTGDKITFIYPDFLTGLRGTFVNGRLKHATAVDIIAERCVDGTKELKIEPSKKRNLTWTRIEANATYIGQNPQEMAQ